MELNKFEFQATYQASLRDNRLLIQARHPLIHLEVTVRAAGAPDQVERLSGQVPVDDEAGVTRPGGPCAVRASFAADQSDRGEGAVTDEAAQPRRVDAQRDLAGQPGARRRPAVHAAGDTQGQVQAQDQRPARETATHREVRVGAHRLLSPQEEGLPPEALQD